MADEARPYSWWKMKDPADAIASTITLLYQNAQIRLADYRRASVQYGASDIFGPYMMGTVTMSPLPFARTERLRINVTQSGIDTLTSKISKNKPRPMFVTNGGSFAQQRDARKLTALMDGIFAENKAYELGRVAFFRDGCVLGDGFIHPYEKNGRVRYERVPAWQLYVDNAECMHDDPRQLHRLQLVDREALIARFPKHKTYLSQDVNPGANIFQLILANTTADLVELRESWRLPADDDDKSEGRYIASVAGKVLADEPWKHAWFPFARFQWTPRLGGWWGQSVCEQVRPIQIEINREAALLQQAHYRQMIFGVMVPASSNVATDHISNEVGPIIKFQGPQAPYNVTPSPAPPERYQWLESKKREAYEIMGISMLSASSQKPAGLNSGKALMEYNDIETDRFRSAGEAYQQAYMDLARMTLALVRDICDREDENGKKQRYPVMSTADTGFDELDFRDIELSESDYILQAFPASSLPNDIAGRIQTVDDLAQRGWISEPTAKKLFALPDIQGYENLTNAAENYAQRIFDRIHDGESVRPQPYDDLAMLRMLALQHYNLWRTQDVGEPALDRLRTFIGELDYAQATADAQMQATKQQAMADQGVAPPEGAMPPGLPPAMPAPMPTMAPSAAIPAEMMPPLVPGVMQ